MRAPIDWDAQPLGQTTDDAIARRLGCSRERVRQVRTARGIPRYAPPRLQIDWSAQPLGKERDSAIATRLGVSMTTVRSARLAAGIARFDPLLLYPELTDDVLHELYVDAEISTYEIADLLDVPQKAVYAALQRRGWARSREEAKHAKGFLETTRIAARVREAKKRTGPLHDPVWLRSRLDAGVSMRAIARELGCGPTVVQEAVKRLRRG